MFWPFLELNKQLVYCPLADFGVVSVNEGLEIQTQAVVAQPVTAHIPLENAFELSGKLVVVERGRCCFLTKVLHAQQAGAVAVLVANNNEQGNGEAFVMDAGQHSSHLAKAVTIPALMVSRSHSITIFQQIREAYLDRNELSYTIRFLGARTTARVLIQGQNGDLMQSMALHQHQYEVVTLLRSRLSERSKFKRLDCDGADVTPNTSTSTIDFASDWSSTSSLKSSFLCSEERLEEPTSQQDNQNELISRKETPAAATMAMRHWSPMATALVILDVQNYFTLRHGYTGAQASSSNDSRMDGTCKTTARRQWSFYECVENELLPTIQDVLLTSHASEGMEVIYSVVESRTSDGRERSRAHKLAGIHVPKRGYGAQVPKQIAPDDKNDIVLPRTGVNVFVATNLDYILRNLMITNIVVMGISVLGSVEACVQTALDKGYHVTVFKEAFLPLPKGGMGDFSKESTLATLAKRGAQVLEAAEFVEELQSMSSW